MRERAQVGDGAALGETGEDDVFARDAAGGFALDQLADDRPRREQTGLVDLPGVGGQRDDVVPGTHDVAAVAGYGPERCVREDEPHRKLVGEVEFRDDRLEVAAVGAQAVQPDDRPLGASKNLRLARPW